MSCFVYATHRFILMRIMIVLAGVAVAIWFGVVARDRRLEEEYLARSGRSEAMTGSPDLFA